MAAINVNNAVLTEEQQDVASAIIIGTYLNAKYPHLMSMLRGAYSTGGWLKRKAVEAPGKITERLIYSEIIDFSRDLLEGLI